MKMRNIIKIECDKKEKQGDKYYCQIHYSEKVSEIKWLTLKEVQELADKHNVKITFE